jgi:hypothetical protein
MGSAQRLPPRSIRDRRQGALAAQRLCGQPIFAHVVLMECNQASVKVHGCAGRAGTGRFHTGAGAMSTTEPVLRGSNQF